jgi:hypothetical protein
MNRTYVMVAIVALVAIFGGFVVAAMFGAADPLRADITAALAPIEREKLDPWNMIIVDGPPSGGARVVQLALLGLLAGGLPAALISIGLARRAKGHWRQGWDAVFQAGLVFQLCSVIVSVCLFLLIMVIAALADVRELFSVTGVMASALLVNAICGALGIRSWRALQAAALPERPPRITW